MKRPFRRLSEGFALSAILALSALSAGCATTPPRPVQYGSSALRTVPYPARPTSAPRVKSISAANTTVATAPAAKSAPAQSAADSGGLDDIVSRIRARDAERAREAAAARRKARDEWLKAHENDLGGVRSRLNAMRVFVSMESDRGAKAAVRDEIMETERQLDAMIDRVGNGRVGFSEASEFRAALEARHERLLETCAPYRAAIGGNASGG